MPPPPTWLLALTACVGLAHSALGCTATQAKVVETVVARIGCELVSVLAHNEQVGTLCADIAGGVEQEIARMAAPVASPLLGHRMRRHSRPVRVAEHVAGRDPGETIEPEYLGAVKTVVARLGKDGGA